MSKSKKIAISFLVAACAVFVSLAFVACGKSSVKKSGSSYGHGEEGWYYYEATSSTEYLMSLQSGVFMISEASSEGYVGTYAFSEDDKTISFITNDGEAFDANFADDAMQIEITGTRPYTFLRKVDYTVTFKDGSATVGTQSVTYGKRATSLDGEKDGFVFLGWYTDETYTTAYKFDTGVMGDLSLYAYYIEIDPSAANYEVQFISGGKVISTVKTVNGVILDSYFPEVSGVVGWWVSDTNEEGELTYKYDGETLYENTKLFAVEGSALYASVYDDEVTWETEVASVAIFVDGTAIASTARGGSFSYDFSSLSAGKHTVTLTSAAGDEELIYVSHGLKRVSTFAVYGNILVYNAIENAQYYYISVECGNSAHNHSMVYNGNTLTYDFSDCEMAEDGIKFTVYAYAQGWEKSVSDTFVYLLKMERAEVTIDSSSDTATWAPVYDITGETLAAGYEIYINGEYVVTTLNPEYSLKSYDLGESVTIEVKPLAPGYYSEKSEAASYTKSTLAAPEITEVSAYSITWSEVTGATNYIIYVNGKQIETVESGITTYDLYDDPDFVVSSSYVITVRAVSGTATQNSQLSDEIVATDSEMAPLLVYENGIVYWQYALAADTYYVTVSRGEDVGDETAVTGQNSFPVTFVGSGENLITVYFKTTDGESAKATLSVTAYAIIFNSEGGETIETLYVAKGDTLNLETPEYPAGDATFLGWYTLPDPDGSRVVSDYAGDGVLIESGSVFSGNSTLVLYACWEAVKIYIVLNTGSHGDVEGATSVNYQMALNVAKYTLPVPESNDAAYVFYGWYSGENGTGTRYTYYDGSSRVVYTDSQITTLYARWVEVLSFDETEYNGETYAKVSKGSEINLAPEGEVTIPATYEIGGKELTVGIIESDAFGGVASLITLNIPDTVVFISTVDNGYSSGSGAFASSGALSAVNIYATGDGLNTTREIFYYSYNGILFKKDGDGAQLIYYPWGNKGGSVVIPESVSNENEYETSGSGSEKKVVRAVTSVAAYAFYGNTSITNVTIPATISNIETGTFGGCTHLTNIYFNEVVMSGEISAAGELEIEEYAFSGCTRLEAVTLPSRLSALDYDAFSGCTKLTSVSVETGGAFTSYGGILYSGENTVYYCPRGKGDIVWKNGVTRIGEKAFENCVNLTSIVIPTTVTYIGKSAFEGCINVTVLDFQNRQNANPLTIDERAFYGCVALRSVSLPVGLETLGYQAFAGCTLLATVEMDCLPGTRASDLDFAEGAFDGGVENIVFGENVPLIRNFLSIFGRSSLRTVTVTKNENYLTDDSGVVYGLDAASFEQILLWAPTISSGSYVILGGTTEIGCEAFRENSSVSSVTISREVVKIDSYAFYGCSSLANVYFEAGSSLEIIEDYAFASSGLMTISIPASVKYIGTYTDGSLTAINVFSGCSSLNAVNVEDGGTNFVSQDGILYVAVGGVPTELVICPVNNSQTEITIPATVTKVWDRALYGNTKITKVTFENTGRGADTEIDMGTQTFRGCTSLTEVTLPMGLVTVPSYAFTNCTSMTKITIPYTVTTIENVAFSFCSALTDVTFEELPSGTSIDDYPLEINPVTSNNADGAFDRCTGLEEITLPERTVEIGRGIFYDCQALKKVTLSANIESIPSYAFHNCYKLEEIVFGNGNGASTKLETISADSFRYAGRDAQSGLKLVLPGSVGVIEGSAFSYAYISTLTLNEGLTSINGYLFGTVGNYGMVNEYYNSSFTEIKFPSSLTELADYAFYNAKNIEKIEFADGCGITSIGEYTFYGCSKLEAVSIPAGVTEISGYAFYGCTSMKNLTIPSGVTEVGSYAFYNCAMETVTIPETVEIIGSYAFSNCSSLSSVTFSVDETEGTASIGSIGNYAFRNCTSLTSFTFPRSSSDTGIALGDNVFNGCSSLASLTLVGTITNLANAINGCSSITSVDATQCDTYVSDESQPILYTKESDGSVGDTMVLVYGDISGEMTIPSAVTTIGESAFKGQAGLTSVKIPLGITLIGASAFYGCENLASVAFGDGSSQNASAGELEIGNQAFYGTKISSIDFNSFKKVTLGSSVFQSCESLTSFTIGANISLKTGTGTGDTAAGTFAGCTGLKTVVLDDSVDVIPAYTFYKCTSLTTVYRGSDSASFTQDAAGLSGLELGLGAFNGSGLVVVTLSEYSSIATGTSSSNGVFGGCEKLASVELGGMTSLPSYTFYGCTALVSVGQTSNDFYLDSYPVINLTGFEEIATYLFYNCSSIEMIICDAGCSFGQNAFYGTTKLSTIAQTPAEGASLSYTAGTANLAGVTLGRAVFAKNEAITHIDLSPATTLTAESGSSEASSGSLSYMKALLSVNLGGMTALVDGAFVACTALTTVTGSEYLTTLGEDTFWNCSALNTVGNENEVVDFSSVTSYGQYSLQGCAGVEKVVLREGTEIKGYDFENDSSLIALATSVDGLYLDNEKQNPVVDLSGFTLNTAANYCFYMCESIETVILGAGTSTIPQFAFYGCKNLSTVAKTMDSLASDTADLSGLTMNYSAFYGTGIKNLVLSEYSVITAGTNNYKGVFQGCESLVSVDFGDMTTIPAYTFYGCTSLESIVLSYDCNKVNAYAFYGCTSLSTVSRGTQGESGTADFSDMTLNGDSFRGTAIEKAVFNAGSAFSFTDANVQDPHSPIADCTSLTTVIFGAGTIPSYFFWGCTALTTIASAETGLTSGVVDLSDILLSEDSAGYIFYGCTSMSKVILNQDNTTIARCVFYGCSSLTTVGVGDSVTDGEANLCGLTLSYAAFGASGVEKVKLNAGTTITAGMNGNDGYIYQRGVFTECMSLTEVDLGGLTSVPAYTFFGCNALGTITGFENLTSVGAYTFSGTAIISVTLTGTIESLGDGAFANCSSLATVTFENDFCLTSIPDYLFSGTAITAITIPSCVTSVGVYAFYNCENLETVTFAECSATVTIGEGAFAGTAITSITIPSMVTKLGAGAFANCSALSSVLFEEGSALSSVGDYVFAGTSITTISIPEGVETVGEGAFRGCSSLVTIVVPSKVTKIGSDAFTSCSSSLVIYYCGSADDWEGIALGEEDDTSFENLTVYYYSEEKPDGGEEGFWHYDETSGEPTMWTSVA